MTTSAVQQILDYFDRLPVQSIVTIPHVKLIRKLGILSPEQLSIVEEVVRLWLGL